jgi:hypothetical protein
MLGTQRLNISQRAITAIALRRQHPHHESLILPPGLQAIQCRRLDLPHNRHTMRRDKNARVDIELLIDSAHGEKG